VDNKKIFDIDNVELYSAYNFVPANDWWIAEHEHDFWEFIYFNSGSGDVVLPDTTIHPGPYQLVVYPPGVSHAESADAIDPEQTVVIALRVPTFEGHWNIPYVLPDNGGIGYLARKIVEATQAKDDRLANYFAKAFLAIIEYEATQREPIRGIEFAKDYLKNNLQCDFNLNALAEMCDLSASYFSTLFTERFGMSPIKYLKNERMSAASSLLRETKYPIGKISELVGYDDQLYFSRLFTIHFGVSPSQYRKEF